MWYKYNQATQNCQCIPLRSLVCDGEYAHADIQHILTYNDNKNIITEIKMKHQYLGGYNKTDEGYRVLLLPNNISELNQYMCDPLNRKDYMCSRCKHGYGPPITYHSLSCAGMCYSCKDEWKNLLIYLSVNFIPLTVFYLLILVFQVRLTSAPTTCFIIYSQLTVLAFYEECGFNSTSETALSWVKFTDAEGTLRVGTKILLTIYGMFNLDFFHYVLPPFCISSQLSPVHIFFLGYISAFYPFLLILLTWLCVELHGRNIRPIVCLWRPFNGCFVFLRRGWNTKSDLIDVFASFFLLSYSKILYLILLMFNHEEIANYSLRDGLESYDYVLKADFSIVLFKNSSYIYTYIIMACFAVILGLLFIILPMLLLFFYPTTIFQRLLSAKCVHTRFRIFLYTFIEKFQCCYRDGLDGTKDMRSFSGIYLLVGIIVYFSVVINRFTLKFNPSFVPGFVFSVTALLIALSRPYNINIVDSIFLLHTATMCYIIGYIPSSRPRLFLPLIQIIFSLPFMVVFILTIYRMARCGILQLIQHVWNYLKRTVIVKFYGSLIPQTQTATTYGATNY